MRFSILSLIVALTFNINTANAISISFDPSVSVIDSGTSLDVDVLISDLGSFITPSLGSFALDVLFDETILAFNSAIYSDALGIAGIDTDILTTSGIGSVNLDNYSYLLESELDALQDSSFVLATLNFTGISVGTSALDLFLVDIASAPGSDLTSSVSTISGSVEVQSVANVPAPFTLMLLIPSFAFMGMMRKRK